MNEIDFYGRPLGLGNRFIQIIRLEAICARYEIGCNYFWNNYARSQRRYDILVESDKVKIVKSFIRDRLHVKEQIARILPQAPANIWTVLSQEELFIAAKKLKPLFSVAFEDGITPIGIHIRGTDRIRGPECKRPHFAAGIEEFDNFLDRTISTIISKKFEHVFICADDERYRKRFIEALGGEIIVCNPICDNRIPDYYRDFFALTLCSKIYLASKFSSFSICASLIGNIPIVIHAKARKSERVWKALFEVM